MFGKSRTYSVKHLVSYKWCNNHNPHFLPSYFLEHEISILSVSVVDLEYSYFTVALIIVQNSGFCHIRKVENWYEQETRSSILMRREKMDLEVDRQSTFLNFST